ncbi:MAG: transposase [Flavobacteriales bacterium]
MAELPKRATHRWTGYDYANVGVYYLTICTQDRLHRFGHIADGVLHPSPIGELARQCWDEIPQHMSHVDVGEFVVMPNHVHGIVVIRERLVVPVGADHDRPGIATDHDRPGIATDHDRPGIATDHDRPGTIPDPDTIQRPVTMPEHDATPDTGSPNAMADAPDERTANAPTAQMRADHDRPLRPPADPGAPPERIMPIVPVGSLGRIVRAYKSAVTRMAYRDGLLPHGIPLWQRNYWDRVIRDDAEHERVARYIRDNPANWKGDRFNR